MREWLNAQSCAEHLDIKDRAGNVSRRNFLERWACLPGFPKPMGEGPNRRWKKSEIDDWADEYRRANRAA